MYGQTHQHDGREPDYRVLNVRLNPALHDRLRQLARENGDTIAGTIRALLRAGVEQRSATEAGHRG